MIEFINFLQSFGDIIVEFAGFPILFWTVFAVPLTILLHRMEEIPAVYQYHSRVALLLALPLSIAGSYLADKIFSSTESAGAAFLVIQNPISASASASESQSISGFGDPMFWVGALGVIVISGSLVLLLKMLLDFIQLKKMESDLQFNPLKNCPELVSNLPEIGKETDTQIAYSNNTHVPFTYGWYKTKIVIPADLKEEPDTLSMAVQHELMHIKHRDFLLNGLLMFVKALFWFHPLTHHLYNSAHEYREITCDGEVLANKKFSKKRYASLLFELAKREHQTNLAMSMAVNPSSLKKRIKIMSSQDNLTTKFRSSFLLTLTFAVLLVLTISCTDMAEDGITNSEIEQTQSQMATAPDAPTDSQPLYIINSEEWESNESNAKKLSRLKSKYIESINVLKGEEARSEYGEKGKNGVIEMSVLNPDKAFSDLKDEAPMPPSSPSKSDEGDFFVAVEEMPELKGGLGGLQQKINYPETAQKAGIEGRVIVQFIVNEQGEVEDPNIIRGIGGGADKEAMRVVKQAEFEPGMQKGQPVRVQYSLPITFELSSDDSEE